MGAACGHRCLGLFRISDENGRPLKALKLIGTLAAATFWVGVGVWCWVLPDPGVEPVREISHAGASVQLAVIRQDAGAMAPVSTMYALEERGGRRKWGGITLEGDPETLAIRSELLAPSAIRLSGARLKDLKEVARHPDADAELSVQWEHE